MDGGSIPPSSTRRSLFGPIVNIVAKGFPYSKPNLSVPASVGGRKPELSIDKLSSILKASNNQFENIECCDTDRFQLLISVGVPARVAADRAYINAHEKSHEQNDRIEHDKVLERIMNTVLKEDKELFQKLSDNDSLKK